MTKSSTNEDETNTPTGQNEKDSNTPSRKFRIIGEYRFKYIENATLSYGIYDTTSNY